MVVSKYIFFLVLATISNSAVAAYPTQVIQFQPVTSENMPVQKGYCFSESIAANRSDAWRCMVESAIYDPCFSAENGSIVCDSNPVKYQTGFILKLIKPLPNIKKSSPTPNYTTQNNGSWLLKLTDGSICTPNTGSLPLINNMSLKYGCSDSSGCSPTGECPYMTGLLDAIKTGQVWIATKVIYSVFPKIGLKIQKTQSVTISAVWQ